MGGVGFLRIAAEIAEAGVGIAGVLVVMTIDTQQFPIAAIRRVVVVIMIAVVHRQLLQVFTVELARAATTDPRVHFQRPATVALLALIAGGPSIGNDAIKLVGGIF